MRGQGLRHQRINLGLVAHIAIHVKATELAGQRCPAGIVNVGDDDFGILTRKAANAGLTNALRSARNQADTIGQAEGDF